MPHAIALRRRPKPSATAAPEIGVESLYAIASELPPLLARWGREFKDEADLDWQQLLRMAATDTLRITTARDAGVLIGFAFNIVGAHLIFKSTRYGITNMVWIDQAYRRGWFPLTFLRANLDMLREAGCQQTCIAHKAVTPRLGKVYQRLGYRLDELSYVKAL
jgi:hypothetical protein